MWWSEAMDRPVVEGTQITNPRPMQAPTSRSEKLALRATVVETVGKFVDMQREELWAKITRREPGWTQQQVQMEVDRTLPALTDYDPVVGMALMSVDLRLPSDLRLRAYAETAQYLRPKLKSIEIKVDPRSPEEEENRQAMKERVVAALEQMAANKRAGPTIEGEAREAGDEAPAAADQ